MALHRRTTRAQVALALALALGALGAAADAVASNRATPRHVVLIGLDGLGGDWVEAANAPTLKTLAANGTSTLVMQDVLGTSSSQNWMSMIAGAGPDQHGVYTNGWERGDSIPTPTIFAIWREQRPTDKIGALYHWGGFGRLVEDNVCDVKENPGDHFATTARAVEYIRSDQPNLLFVHLDNIDGAGHGSRWGSEEYFEAISVADGLVAQIVAALEEVGILADTAIFISSDHGGNQFGGHGADRSPLRNIPFIASGNGIAQNTTVTREVRIFDISATMAEIVGLMRPSNWIATAVYEALARFVPPPPPTDRLEYTFVTDYLFLYNSTDELNVILPEHSVWRPVAPAGFVALGDVAVFGTAQPAFAVPVVRDVPSVLAPPAAFERIWTNTYFQQFRFPVTFWQPVPSYGYTCVGTWAETSLPSEKEPSRDAFRCIHSSYTVKADTGALVARNAGVSRLESGWWVSLWTPQTARTDIIDAQSFIVRRDLDGPGYNKYYVLDLAKLQALKTSV